MWSDSCTFQTQGRGCTSSGCSLMTALKTSYTVTDTTSQPPACPSALFPQRILQTWSARDVACRVRSSRLAISFHICSQPDCRSLSSRSRITPANRDIQIPNLLKYLFCGTRREPKPSSIRDDHHQTLSEFHFEGLERWIRVYETCCFCRGHKFNCRTHMVTQNSPNSSFRGYYASTGSGMHAVQTHTC